MSSEFVASSGENIVEISSAFSCCEHSITSTIYQCDLETLEDSLRSLSSEAARVRIVRGCQLLPYVTVGA
jgi:hypothetical protein